MIGVIPKPMIRMMDLWWIGNLSFTAGMKRDYGTDGNNGTNGNFIVFRLFRYFRLFRNLSSIVLCQ
jgi:hypothetical protein